MSENKIQENPRHLADIIFPFGIILTVCIMATPLSAHAINILLLLNLVMAMCFLGLSFVKKTVFAWPGFSSLLLLTTLFRLAVNVSVSRLVLNGQNSNSELIGPWSDFPSWAAVTVCFVAVLGLVALQFFYIRKIAVNISEIMKTDQAAVYYGKISGSIKFIRNEAIAGLALIIVNCFGSLYIAVFQRSVIPLPALNQSLWFTILAAIFYLVPAMMHLIAIHSVIKHHA